METDRIKPEEVKKNIEKCVKIEPHLIYYVYTCGHAHGPEKDIRRRYCAGSVKTICPICKKGWLLTKYKECGGCGAVSCSLQTREAPTGTCQYCPTKTNKKKVVIPKKMVSILKVKEVKTRPRIKKSFYLPQNVECSKKSWLCGGFCILEACSMPCLAFDGDRKTLDYAWVEREVDAPEVEKVNNAA